MSVIWPTDLYSLARPTNTVTTSPEALPPMVSWVSIATCCRPTSLVRIGGAAPPACQAAAVCSLVCLMAMQGRHALTPSAKGSSITLPWQCSHYRRWRSWSGLCRRTGPYHHCWSGINTLKTTAALTEERSPSTASETTGRRGWRTEMRR